MGLVRTDKELLQIVLDNIDMLETGLCLLTIKLRKRGVISSKEELIIDRIVQQNNPKLRYGYYFKTGAKQPRIEFLKMLIEKYS